MKQPFLIIQSKKLTKNCSAEIFMHLKCIALNAFKNNFNPLFTVPGQFYLPA